MLDPVHQPSQQTPMIYSGWSAEECIEKRVNNLLKEKFLSLVTDGYRRMTTYRQNRGSAAQGPWYANTNFRALQEIEKEPKQRLNHFRNKGNFYHGFPPKGFNHVAEPNPDNSSSGKRLCGYALKSDVSPDEGVKSAKESFSYIDCHESTQIAQYDTFLEIAGNERFNAFFDPKGKHPLRLDPELSETPLNDFQIDVPIKSAHDCKVGDKVLFRNLPIYGLRNPHGEAQGYWCYCIEAGEEGLEPKFATFGHSPEGLTEDQMHSVLAADCNEEPFEDSVIVTEKLEKQIQETYIRKTTTLEQISREELLLRQEGAKEMTFSKTEIEFVRQSDPTLAGLYPMVKRIDVRAIHRHLLPNSQEKFEEKQSKS